MKLDEINLNFIVDLLERIGVILYAIFTKIFDGETDDEVDETIY